MSKEMSKTFNQLQVFNIYKIYYHVDKTAKNRHEV